MTPLQFVERIGRLEPSNDAEDNALTMARLIDEARKIVEAESVVVGFNHPVPHVPQYPPGALAAPGPGEYGTLRAANVARQAEWDTGNQITLAYRGNELAGEVGEACNIIKKVERERMGIAGSRATVEQLAEELADVVICTDLIAMQAGIDLDAAVAAKFNATSEKVGLKTRLTTAAPPAAPGEYVSLIEELKQNEFDYYGPVMVRAAAALAAMQEQVGAKNALLVERGLSNYRLRGDLDAAQARIAALEEALEAIPWLIETSAPIEDIEKIARAALKGGENV
jgi:NTP pyrophosphatase (non-canonical NTP hydrolase)